jgi:hypothetical protein
MGSMPIEAQSDLFAALARGDGNALVGTAESIWMDFKKTPYRFGSSDDAYQRLELVKDVTALANSGGGVIVVGYETQPETTTGQDVAVAWKRFPQSLVNPKQYQAIIESQTYPPFRDTQIRWWLHDATDAILTIEVAAAQDQDRPIIVTRVQEEGINRALLMGIFERSGDQAGAVLPAQIHSQLRLGRLIERGALQSLTTAPLTPGGPSPDERSARLAIDTRDCDFEGRRRYYLQAWPGNATLVRDIHDETFRRLLSQPPAVRNQGFGLRTGIEPSTIPGGGLRILGRRSTLSLQRDGVLTWIAAADGDFLAWADERRGQRHILNQLALVEATLEFARLYVLTIRPRCEPAVEHWYVNGGMADLRASGETSALPGGPLDEFGLPLNVWGYEPSPAPANDLHFEAMQFADEEPGIVALGILREVYANFGLPEAAIPYTAGGRVDASLFPQT